MADKKKAVSDSTVIVTPINPNDPLLIYIDDLTFRISSDTEVPAAYLDTLLSTQKVKIVKPQKEDV